jgi:hypothetical protein
MQSKIYQIARAVLKSNLKIEETGKIDTPNICMVDHSPGLVQIRH